MAYVCPQSRAKCGRKRKTLVFKISDPSTALNLIKPVLQQKMKDPCRIAGFKKKTINISTAILMSVNICIRLYNAKINPEIILKKTNVNSTKCKYCNSKI